MDYEIVELKEKTAAGISARTSNQAPDMSMVIGKLWGRFFGEGIYASVANKANSKALGIYTDYAGDEKADYTVMTACEVKEAPKAQNLEICKIPAGRYAKIVARGDMHKAVADAWMEIWKMNLPRAFTCDFEEYQNGSMDHAEIHIYISLKEEKYDEA